jgi:excinuclease ABC subunit A
LFARIGKPHCPQCGLLVVKQTKQQIFEKIFNLPEETRLILMAPVVRDKKGEHKGVLEKIQKAGYVRVRLDKEIIPIEEALDKDIDKQKSHTLEVIIDRINISKEIEDKQRLIESLETALDLGDGFVMVALENSNEDFIFSEHFACPKCNTSLLPIEPRNFSFNSPHGACVACSGLGTKLEIDEDLVIPNKKLTIAQGAIRPWARARANQSWYVRILEQVGKKHGFSVNEPLASFSKKQLRVLLYGTGDKKYKMDFESANFSGEYATHFEGVIPNLERRYKDTESDYVRGEIERYMRVLKCPDCLGKRLNPQSLAVTVAEKNISEVTGFTIDYALPFFKKLTTSNHNFQFTDREQKISKQILKEIISRLQFLQNVGLEYLTLDRAAATLSGGEAQRIRLATQIGSALVGVLYILDEPSIGLHQKDNHKLIKTLQDLRDLGNTVIVVEHDEDTILAADFVIDIGPGAGEHGGEVVVVGTPLEIKKNRASLTGRYLSGKESIVTPKTYHTGNGKYIKVLGATEHNLKNLNITIPLGKLVAITGVSGSGKSTLMTDILAKALSQYFYRSKELPGVHKEIKGLENLDKVINIDQSPIGRTPRSNPATYTGVFTPIRELYAELPEAKMRGYDPGRFSFNVKGGRCEACQGDGMVRIEMNFLPDVYVECEECHGKRYNQQALEIHYRGKNISDVLNMTVEEAMHFFANIPAIHDKLETLNQVGLSYVHLGQSATTLSGGEAQRVKLATELARRATGKTLYILDEPTTGLHFADVKRLLSVLDQLVTKGNSVLVIEHNLDVIKSCDWILDLGPDGGDKGGEIVAEGTPREVAKVKRSYTGQFLKRYFP